MAQPSDVKKDQELINILTTDARTPLSQIAKKLGVSLATVQRRLARLKKEGVIAVYTTVLGKEPDATTISAIILTELEVNRQGNVIAALRKRPEAVHCYTLSRLFDLLVKINCALASQLGELLDWMPRWRASSAPPHQLSSPENSKVGQRSAAVASPFHFASKERIVHRNSPTIRA
jgi:DNA-binding Lrp family transcriptional regulator